MRAPALLLAVLATFPALAITLYFLAGDVKALSDPVWRASQPRNEYVLMMIAVKGALLAAIGVSVYGIVAQSRRIGLIGAGALAIAAFPLILGGAGVIVLLSAAMVALVSWKPPRIG